MVQPVDKPEFFELRGKGYNVMLQKPDQFGKFKVDLIVEGAELDKAIELSDRYGFKIKTELGYAGATEKMKTKYVTFTAKFADGKYPRKFIPTKDEQGNVVSDLISHGADLTLTVKVYPYQGGTDARGYAYPAGNGYQLEGVLVHSYEPFKAASNA